tara:strand:+ start:373 stop:1191 length:819 start_codon:yes stop_codon:yes gene_type:complete
MNTGIILKIRYFFYSGIGVISFILRGIILSVFQKLNKINYSHQSIAVLGRGVSANKFFIEDYRNHSKVFLANYVNNDLTKKDLFKLFNKELVFVYNICEVPAYKILLLFFIKVKEIIISQPDEKVRRSVGKSIRGSYRLNIFGLKIRGVQSSKNLDIFADVIELKNISTGLYAIFEAAESAKKNNIKKIFLYGFDLYSGPLNKNSILRDEFDGKYTEDSDEYYNICRDFSINLSKSLDYIVSKYPNILFVYHTTNKYQFSSENIIKYKFKKN